jgi:VCBS repeat-containing protein
MATTSTTTATNSISNTPQAMDDNYTLNEDQSSVQIFDVMAGDLGGKAKVLWSLDDGSSVSDLLQYDGAKAEATTNDTSKNGAKIWITADGKVGYDAATLSPSFKAQLQAMNEGDAPITDTFTYAIRLGNGTLSWATVTVTFTGVNDAPEAHQIAAQNFDEDTPWTFQLPAGAFTDVDNATLIYSASQSDGTPLPAWMQFDAATQTFSGTPPQDFNGSFSLKVTASDGKLSASQDFQVTINPINDAPVVAAQIGAQNFNEDTSWTFQVPAGSFSDVDGDTLAYSATLSDGSALPNWLTFNASTKTFSGTPPQDYNGKLSLTVTASDGKLSASQDFQVTINPINDAPVITSGSSGAVAL